MQRLFRLAIGATLCTSPAVAAPFAIKCLDQNEMAYYVTFDPDANRAIYESAGRNFLKGFITSSTQGQTAFVLKRDNTPDFELVWDQAKKTLSWKGVPNDGSRLPGENRCTPTPLGRFVPKFEELPPYR